MTLPRRILRDSLVKDSSETKVERDISMVPSDEHRVMLQRAESSLGGSLGAFRLPRGQDFVVSHGKGSKIYDVDGQEYIDYLLGSGPLILGHAHRAVVRAVQNQAELGSTYYAISEPAIQLAEEIIQAVPCSETVKFVSSGTEATFHAMRIARTFTGKPKILKFEGGFHGVSDYALMSSLSGQATEYPKPIPDSDGIPQEIESDVLISQWNDISLTEHILAQHEDEIAAVICEPLQRSLSPIPQFLEELREVTRRHGVLLIFDEVVTGFRLAYGGAQSHYGVVPDIATFGKALACGYPIGALTASKEIMDVTDPSRRGVAPLAHLGGTMNGNPISTSAGLATLSVLRAEGTYEYLYLIASRLKEGIQNIAARHNESVAVVGEGPVFQIFFTTTAPTNYSEVLATDRARARAFGLNCVDRGLFLNPADKMYVSTAHSESDVDRTLDIVESAMAAL
jgi:glutamate-1-semialdehyde 2,1-aminomutase